MEMNSSIAPRDVVSELEKHVLVDGFRVVIDLQKSHGPYLVDAVTGRQILDLYGFYGSLPIGYNHPYFEQPEVRRDLQEAARIKVANSDVYSVPYATFVSTFSRVVGLPPLERYFFIDGGALAVENAIKAAMDWKVRLNLAAGRGERGTAILHFEGAFHGRSGYTMSLTNTDPRKTDYFAKFSWPRVMTPCLDFALPESQRAADAREKEQRAETRIRDLIKREGVDIAAMIIEPIQGEGGDRHFRGEWFRTLRSLCDENDILLIFDEVQSGMGITGKTWCCEHFDVRPDLLVFGKKAQTCGVMAGPRLDAVQENCFRLPSRINSTWGSNLTDMVRSTHYLRILEKERLVENAKGMGQTFLEALQELAREIPTITAVRGRGLMLAFDLPDRAIRDRFYKGLFEVGLLAIRCGERSIRFRPALDIRGETIQCAVGMLRDEWRRLGSTGSAGKPFVNLSLPAAAERNRAETVLSAKTGESRAAEAKAGKSS